jgi:hypothetical protein
MHASGLTEESCGQFWLGYYFLRGKLHDSWSGLLSMKRIIDWSDRLTISFCLVCATNSDGAAVVRHDGGRSCLVRFSRIGIDSRACSVEVSWSIAQETDVEADVRNRGSEGFIC